MNWRVCFLSCCLFVAIPTAMNPKKPAPKPAPQSNDGAQDVVVPEEVSALLPPILDEKPKGRSRRNA